MDNVMPFNSEAEQAVIGSILLDNEQMGVVLELMSSKDFYVRQYGIIFDAMKELYSSHKPIDPVTLREELKEHDASDDMLSPEFIRDILDAVPTSANVRSYAQIVHEKATLRRLIKASEDIARNCYTADDPLGDILEGAEKSIFTLIQSHNVHTQKSIQDLVMEATKRIEDASETSGYITGLPTGFADLDYMTAGLQPADLVLIAARPSMGKTAFALSVLYHVAVKRKIPAVIFSLEMSSIQLVNRLFAMSAKVDSHKIRTGNLNEEEWTRVMDAADMIHDSKLIINDTAGISATELCSKCRKYKLDHDIQLIVVDYIQMMSSGTKSENRQQEISDISRALKSLARELNVPVIALSQLNRSVESRTNHRPMLADIRESGAIEQDADVIMFLYRDDYYNHDSESTNIAEVIIAKQRNGATGTIELIWQPEYTQFYNIAKENKYD